MNNPLRISDLKSGDVIVTGPDKPGYRMHDPITGLAILGEHRASVPGKLYTIITVITRRSPGFFGFLSSHDVYVATSGVNGVTLFTVYGNDEMVLDFKRVMTT